MEGAAYDVDLFLRGSGEAPRALKAKVKGTARCLVRDGEKAWPESRTFSSELDLPVQQRGSRLQVAYYAILQGLAESMGVEKTLYFSDLSIITSPPKGFVAMPRFLVWELGGARADQFGEAWILADNEGGRKAPLFEMRAERRQEAGKVAGFCLWPGDQATGCHVSVWRGQIVLAEIVALSAEQSRLESQVIWRGNNFSAADLIDKVPKKHECFSGALVASLEKASCPRCTHVHYGISVR